MPIIVGSVAVDVVPDASRFATRLRAALLPQASRIGDEVGNSIGDRIATKVRAALPEGLAGGARAAAAAGSRAGEDFGGNFASTARRRIDAALRDLPKPNVGINASELDAELADIRARLQALSDVRIGVDLDTTAAIAEMTALKARLDELGARSPDIAVKVDAAAAAAQLAAVQAEADHLDGKDVDIHVDDHGSSGQAIGSLGALATAGIALGPAIIPVAAAVAAAIAGIGAGAIAAVAGLGVIAIAFSGISGAVKELTSNQTKAGATAARSAATQVSSAAAIASAQQQLADAHRGVADAERNAAASVKQALFSEQDAETSLATAQRTAKQAQLDLTAARRQARQDLEDLTLQVQDGALAQQQANLDVAQAQQDLNKTLTDPTSTTLQRQQAQLTYDEAVQQVTDLGVRQKRLVDQQKAATKAGVDGAAGVVAANQRLTDSETALAKARRDARQAEQAVTEARRAGAEAILTANERVASAERSLSVAEAQSAASSAGALATTKSKLDALGPAGQRLARFIAFTLLPIFKQLRDVAQAALLPGLQRGLEALLPLVPGLTGFIAGLARTIGDLFNQGAKALTAPFWTQFFGFLAATVGPDLRILVRTLENLGKGFAGLFQAFSPVATSLGGGLEQLTGKFATFGATAGKNPAFQHFLDYLRKTGPQVAATIGSLVKALGHVVAAVAPIGTVALSIIKGFADAIRAIPVPVLTALAAVIGPLALAIKAASIWLAILNSDLIAATAAALGLEAVPLVALIVAIVAAVVLLVLGIIELVKHWSAVWATIKNVTDAVWRHVIKPAFTGIVDAGKTVVHWLKQNWPLLLAILTGPFGLAALVIARHWDTIKAGASTVKDWIVGKFDAVVGFFTKMPDRIAHAAKGMWDGITTAFKAAIDTVIGWWDGFVSHLKIPAFKIPIPFAPDIHFGGIDLGSQLQIPYLADGGVATAATLGVFGEAGREAILPLDDPRTMKMLRDALLGPAGRAGNGQPLIGTLEVYNPAPEPTSTSLPTALRKASFRLGMA